MKVTTIEIIISLIALIAFIISFLDFKHLWGFEIKNPTLKKIIIIIAMIFGFIRIIYDFIH